MANSFNREEVVLFDRVLERFEKELTLSRNCSRFTPDATGMQRQGDVFWRPMPFIAETIDGMDISGQYQDLKQLSVPATLSHIKNVPWTLDAKELRDDWYMNEQARAAAQALSAQVEVSVALNVAMTGAHVVKRGALEGYADLAQCGTSLTSIGVPRDNRSFFLDTQDYNEVADNLAKRQTVNGKVQTALEDASIGRYAAFSTYDVDIMPRLTAAAGGAITVAGAGQVLVPQSTSTAASGEVENVDNRTMLLTVAAATTDVKAGDAFTIAGVNRVHLITKEDTGRPFTLRVHEVVNGTTLRVTALVADGPYQNCTAAPADGAAITWLNTTDAPVNVFWQGSSVEVIGGRLAADKLRGMEVMQGTTGNGIQLVMARQGEIDDFTQKYRWTIFYGTSNLQPLFNGIMLGNQS